MRLLNPKIIFGIFLDLSSKHGVLFAVCAWAHPVFPSPFPLFISLLNGTAEKSTPSFLLDRKEKSCYTEYKFRNNRKRRRNHGHRQLL